MGNFESMSIFDFLTWLTIICRPLSLNMLAYWYRHLVDQRAMLFSGVLCLEGWMKSWEKRTSLSSLFPTLLSPTHSLAQWYFPRSLLPLVFGCSVWNVLPSLVSHSVAAILKRQFWCEDLCPSSTQDARMNWQCSVLYEDHCECIARQAV